MVRIRLLVYNESIEKHELGLCSGVGTEELATLTPEDLVRNIHGAAAVAELDGDEVGYSVAVKVAEIKRQR